MASTFVSITTSAYTCAEFMLVWKLTFFVIPASAAIFFKIPFGPARPASSWICR